MRKGLLMTAAMALGAVAALQAAQILDPASRMLAFAATPALMEGCGDVPEAVALAETLRLRGIAVDRGIEALDQRAAEIAAAEARLKARAAELRAAKEALVERQTARTANSDEGIARLIAVYDVMKPAEAAEVLATLPPDFGAEILARVQPEVGARIIAALEPSQAAILTARMGAPRSMKD